ncbi:MAG: hypothetical protein DRI26_10125 [Chloroflexi bacterium]|nr:MAG: hypothetical protein DRI26_10125 [Chloroflexota bacterium]
MDVTLKLEIGGRSARQWKFTVAGPREDEFVFMIDGVVGILRGLGYFSAHNSRSNTKLTERQLQILRLVKDGLSYEEVGKALGLTRQTIKNHAVAIRRKLKVKNTAGAVALALREGWI